VLVPAGLRLAENGQRFRTASVLFWGDLIVGCFPPIEPTEGDAGRTMAALYGCFTLPSLAMLAWLRADKTQHLQRLRTCLG